MQTGFGLTMEQVQKLVMTPELRQAITVLQLSALELQQYVQNELLENPFLEFKEDDSSDGGESAAGSEGEFGDQIQNSEQLDIDWQEYFGNRSDLGIVLPAREEYPEYSYENFLTQGPTLQEHLQLQLELALEEKDLAIGQFLLGCLDDNGYLSLPLAEAAEKMGCSLTDVERVLRVIQTFDPVGVGARDLEECLLLQLRQTEQPDDYAYAERIVQNYLEDLAQGRLTRIAGELEITVQQAQELANLIRSLNPKPGDRFARLNEVRYVSPDVVVEKVNGDFVVLVNDSVLPRIGINNTYRSLLTGKNASQSDARKYLEGKLNAATWLVRSIEQRRLTLYRVACCIAELQRDFLLYGVMHLKPLNLKQVAELIGVHESTVSRATSNKYIQTPQGVFEFKYLFSSGVSDDRGASFSSQTVKKLIKGLIEGEDSYAPLSDQKLADELKRQGVPISRRTVAKYRSECGLPSAALRKIY